MWLLIPQWIKGIKKLLKRREVEMGELVLLFSLVLIGAIALFSDNIGVNTRLRMLAWDAFFIYAASLFGLKKELVQEGIEKIYNLGGTLWEKSYLSRQLNLIF